MLAEPLAPSPILGLQELFERFDRYEGRIPLDVLRDHLARLDLTRDDLSAFSIFDAECYCRNKLRTGPAYEALLVCWRPGQRSPIHDHVGSSCAFRILQGDCTETVYEPVGDIRPGGSGAPVQRVDRHVESEGFVCATQDADIHEVSNEGESNLQTLHIYSPPMAKMGTYEAVDETRQPLRAVPKGAFV